VRVGVDAGEARLARDALTVPPFRLTLAYDGTDFLGWQLQPGGRTVQGAVEEALARLSGGQRVVVAGAGRTDAGVHALGQVASFELPREMGAAELQRALNGLLPDDVRTLEARPVSPGFHARKSAVSKLYRYELDCGGVQVPQRRRHAAWLPRRLDPGAVDAAAALFVGRRDFSSLASAGGSARTFVRTVSRSEARFDQRGLVYEVEADGFLRKMVRSMVGGLIAAGDGSRTPDDLAAALDACDRETWPAPAPARGLTLVRVDYGSHEPVLG
jgi:tRNA pseudouridine38-40 synthase